MRNGDHLRVQIPFLFFFQLLGTEEEEERGGRRIGRHVLVSGAGHLGLARARDPGERVISSRFGIALMQSPN